MLKERIYNKKKEYFDILRKKWVAATPEEKVRQLFLFYLINELKYPQGLIAVEYSFRFENNKIQRADIVVFNLDREPFLLVECKAEDVTIDGEVLRQASRYNAVIRSPHIVATNGKSTVCLYTSDFINYNYIQSLPSFGERP